MITPPRKIINISKTENNLHFDIRVTIPFETTSAEFIKDVIEMKDMYINGIKIPETGVQLEFFLSTDKNDKGEECVHLKSKPVK
jgi:hypothetical protein